MKKKWHIQGMVDCHCHLTGPHRISQGIETFITGGIGPENWQEQRELAKSINILPCFGLHPYWVASHSKEEFEKSFKLLETLLPEAIALGEIGLDFRGEISKGTDNLQREAFHLQCDLANRMNKVVVLHLVRSQGEIKKFKPLSRGAMVHGFNGKVATAKEFLDLGFYLSIGPSLLKDGAVEESVRYAPMERLLVESDSFHEPELILLVAERMAELKGISKEEVFGFVKQNLRNLFYEEIHE